MLKSKNNIYDLAKKAIYIVISSAPKYFMILSLISLISSSFWVLNTVAVENFFDSVTKLANSNSSIYSVIIAGLFLCLVLVLVHLLNALINLSSNNFYNIATGKITNLINRKSSKIDPISFEDPSILDYINKAHQGVSGSIIFVNIINLIITFYLSYFIFMGIYLYKLNPILILSLIFIFIPVALNQFIRLKIFSNLESNIANNRRESEYYEKCIIDKEYFKETRILGAFSYFNKRYKESLRVLNNKKWEAEKKSNFIELAMKSITLVGYIGVLILLFQSLVNNKISVGAFGAVLSSIALMFSAMEELICTQIGAVTKNLSSVINLMKFLGIKERTGEPREIEGDIKIDFKNVSFKYPESKKYSLEDISFTIYPNETIAIVGENGSGKTTLAKLLLGLYLPTKGEILINGVESSKISSESIFNKFSAVFQKFQRYKMTVKDNVTISDIKNYDKEKVLECLKEADIDLENKIFSKDIDTMLSREFDGIELSGGRWQRLAIARGIYKFNNMIVLDEPTSAIDPLEESILFEKFKEISQNKTSIIITHRMGTVKIADRIIVLGNGKILESGTHDELLNNNGRYKEMYNAQSKWYNFN